MTGTENAYLPPGHTLEGGKRAKATGDYEAWRPEQVTRTGSSIDMGRSIFETILGAVVLAVAVLFLGFRLFELGSAKGARATSSRPISRWSTGSRTASTSRSTASRSVRCRACNLITDPGPNQYLVHVRMTIDPNVQLPTDTMAMIATESLLGGKYMSLEPGVDDDHDQDRRHRAHHAHTGADAA